MQANPSNLCPFQQASLQLLLRGIDLLFPWQLQPVEHVLANHQGQENSIPGKHTRPSPDSNENIQVI